jgi:predicted DNA-binding transcriptional regulator AlpA
LQQANDSSVKAGDDSLPVGVLSFEEVAKTLHCSERWVFHLCNENKLHKVYFPQRKRAIGVMADSLFEYLAE